MDGQHVLLMPSRVGMSAKGCPYGPFQCYQVSENVPAQRTYNQIRLNTYASLCLPQRLSITNTVNCRSGG